MTLAHQPDDPASGDDRIERLLRQLSSRNGNGNGERTSLPSFLNWGMTLFGGSVIVMLGFILNSAYTTNGDLHELKGQVTALQLQVNQLSERVAVNGANYGKR
jgi:hypothetical protein